MIVSSFDSSSFIAAPVEVVKMILQSLQGVPRGGGFAIRAIIAKVLAFCSIVNHEEMKAQNSPRIKSFVTEITHERLVHPHVIEHSMSVTEMYDKIDNFIKFRLRVTDTTYDVGFPRQRFLGFVTVIQMEVESSVLSELKAAKAFEQAIRQ